MPAITTTLSAISPYITGDYSDWHAARLALGNVVGLETPFPFVMLLDLMGIEQVLWCCRAVPGYEMIWRQWAAVTMRRALQRVEPYFPTPPAGAWRALEVAERFAKGEASMMERKEAWQAFQREVREAEALVGQRSNASAFRASCRYLALLGISMCLAAIPITAEIGSEAASVAALMPCRPGHESSDLLQEELRQQRADLLQLLQQAEQAA